jgi:hypothetical protein
MTRQWVGGGFSGGGKSSETQDARSPDSFLAGKKCLIPTFFDLASDVTKSQR